MRSKLLFILTVCFMLSIFSFNAFAQEEQKAQNFIVWEVAVKPDMVNEYEAARKKHLALLTIENIVFMLEHSFYQYNIHFFEGD